MCIILIERPFKIILMDSEDYKVNIIVSERREPDGSGKLI